MSRETILLRQIEAELRRGDRTLQRYVAELRQAGGRYNPAERRRGSARVYLWRCTREVFRHD